MRDFVLYGAGVNALGVIDFFGTERIKGIIDSNPAVHGKVINGIPVISIETYKSDWTGLPVLCTAYYYWDAIKKTLDSNGIKESYRSPWMESNYYDNPESIVAYLEKKEYKVRFISRDPIAEAVHDILKQNGIKSGFAVDISDKDEFDVLVSTTIIEKEKKDELKKSYPGKTLVELYNEIEPLNRDYSLLRKFRNVHKGERCFLIGNGPSIRYEDLEKLHERGEVCFGVNRGYLAFDKTKWRPNYYVVVDRFIFDKDVETVMKQNIPVFTKDIRSTEEIVKKYSLLYSFKPLLQELDNPNISLDIEQGIYGGYTVIIYAIQIAFYMGFKEIYLLGVDMSNYRDAASETAHFYGSYDVNEKLGDWNVEGAIKCLGYAYRELQKKGICLRNATRNVWWDEVPKVDFDTLF